MRHIHWGQIGELSELLLLDVSLSYGMETHDGIMIDVTRYKVIAATQQQTFPTSSDNQRAVPNRVRESGWAETQITSCFPSPSCLPSSYGSMMLMPFACPSWTRLQERR